MPRAGARILEDKDYLTPEERERRASAKERELILRGLTPDWFGCRGDLCLPAGGLNVAVIGGGFAGLAAAWYLRSCGVTTVVFEASERLGGRVLTDRAFVAPKVVEAGAELIGENHPLWRILARRLGLPLVPLADEDDYRRAGLRVRTRFGTHDLTDAEEYALKAALRAPLAAIGRQAAAISETEPWRAPDATRLDAMSVADKLDQLLGRGSSTARTWFEFTLGNDNCAPVAAQSYLGLLAAVSAARMGSDAPGMLGYWMSTETHRCGGGNDRLAERLGQVIGHTIRLRTTVDLISAQPGFDPPLVVGWVQRDAAGKLVDQRLQGFHYAILATPPSVWPAIPINPEMRIADRAIQHGPAIKFLSRYPTEFWRAQKLAPAARWDQLGSIWEGTDQQPGPPWYGLSVFSGGPFVLPAGQYPAKLTALYPKRLSAPGSEQFVNWPAAPHILTGYGVPAVGQASTIFPAQLRPHAQRLYFAGEQTSSGFFGYMEGALQSGARAARDIIGVAARSCPQPAGVRFLR